MNESNRSSAFSEMLPEFREGGIEIISVSVVFNSHVLVDGV